MNRRTKMNRRTALSVGAGTGGLLATAFLPVAVAFADSGTAAVGDAGSGTPVGSAANTTPVGDAGSITPVGSAASTTPVGNGGSTTPVGDAGSTTPVGNGGSSTPTGEAPGSTPTGETPGITPTGEAPSPSDTFTLGNYTFDPIEANGTEGFTPVSPLFSAPPFFDVGQGNQTFDVTSAGSSPTSPSTGTDLGSTGTSAGSGTGTDLGSSSTGSGTDLGSISTHEDVSDLFGIHNTEFTVTGADPASGGAASDLPAVGSVFDVANFGNGFENVYVDIPGSGGAANHITDTLVTPTGDFNIPTNFDAVALLNPGDALSGVDVSSLGSGAAEGAATAAGNATEGAGSAAASAADAVGHAADTATGTAGSAATDALDPLSLLGL